ncbi:MAG: flagellin [Proteobacteria bacterium]|nr:flagellin [Pseudomonadota bacterium]
MAASILTNTSAMIALQTLRATNAKLATVQGQIATGKAIATAKDNSAVFAISKVMESDVSGFKAISGSLSLGGSTIAVASNGAFQIGEILNEIKAKIVSANGENVDRQKLQDEVASLRDQIKTIVGAAQFNGLNMLKDGGTVSILSSLDRSSTGVVTASSIAVAKQDLQTTQAAFGATAVGTADDLLSVDTATIAISGGTGVVSFTSGGAVAGASYRVTLTGAGTNELGTTALDFEYVARAGDTELDVSKQIFDLISAQLTSIGATNTTVARNSTTGAITITNNDTDAGDTITLARTEFLGGTAGGGLSTLGAMDVSTAAGAATALTSIETLIQTTINAQAVFGNGEKRVEIQNVFMNSLIDSFKSGIGSLVDADLEAASARLQALQVQQQLGIQALSIANQQSQNILALFR